MNSSDTTAEEVSLKAPSKYRVYLPVRQTGWQYQVPTSVGCQEIYEVETPVESVPVEEIQHWCLFPSNSQQGSAIIHFVEQTPGQELASQPFRTKDAMIQYCTTEY